MNASSLCKRLFRRRLKRFAREDIAHIDTQPLRALYVSDRCRDDPELLVAIWSELRLREQDLRVLSEPTISVQQDDGHRLGGRPAG